MAGARLGFMEFSLQLTVLPPGPTESLVFLEALAHLPDLSTPMLPGL